MVSFASLLFGRLPVCDDDLVCGTINKCNPMATARLPETNKRQWVVLICADVFSIIFQWIADGNTTAAGCGAGVVEVLVVHVLEVVVVDSSEDCQSFFMPSNSSTVVLWINNLILTINFSSKPLTYWIRLLGISSYWKKNRKNKVKILLLLKYLWN